MKSCYLSDFRIIRPQYEGSQSEAIQALIKMREKLNSSFNMEEVEQRIQKYGKANDQILKRGTEVPDFLGSLDASQTDSKPLLIQDGRVATLGQRFEFYKARVGKIFNFWYGPESRDDKPDHILHVTCTGYIS